MSECVIIRPEFRAATTPMHKKSAEERKAIAAKRQASFKANKERRIAAVGHSEQRIASLLRQIGELEASFEKLQRLKATTMASAAITGKALLREDEIAKVAIPYEKTSGVYFLLQGDDVVYVGQSKNLHARLSDHFKYGIKNGEQFDRYAVVHCDESGLNVLESLYIHYLRPRLNGFQWNGGKFGEAKAAPIALDVLMSALTSFQANA